MLYELNLCTILHHSITFNFLSLMVRMGELVVMSMYFCRLCTLVLVAQLDVHLTGDQEVAGSTLAGSATFFRRDLIVKYFLPSFSPFR